jgi:putative Holliday junction resolvase
MTSSRVMGIDYGSVRIGISLSDESFSIAFGKEAIVNDSNCFKKIADLAKKNGVQRVVLGYPLSLKGTKTSQTLVVEDFEKKLGEYFSRSFGKTSIEIIRWDERFTSKMALNSMIESGMKKKHRQNKENLDIISAALLLQSYLDSLKK